MKKLQNKKGFTLMEMLIVVAIIAILTAIAIPVFSSTLEKAREAADAANIRSAYADVLVQYLDSEGAATSTVTLTQKNDNWETSVTLPDNLKVDATGAAGPVAGGTAVVSVDTKGVVTVKYTVVQH